MLTFLFGLSVFGALDVGLRILLCVWISVLVQLFGICMLAVTLTGYGFLLVADDPLLRPLYCGAVVLACMSLGQLVWSFIDKGKVTAKSAPRIEPTIHVPTNPPA